VLPIDIDKGNLLDNDKQEHYGQASPIPWQNSGLQVFLFVCDQEKDKQGSEEECYSSDNFFIEKPNSK
jgi:hypothetical protein